MVNLLVLSYLFLFFFRMVLFGNRNSVRNEDVIPDISAPILLRMTAIRNSMRVERHHQFIEDKNSSLCGQGIVTKTCYKYLAI